MFTRFIFKNVNNKFQPLARTNETKARIKRYFLSKIKKRTKLIQLNSLNKQMHFKNNNKINSNNNKKRPKLHYKLFE